MRATIWPLIVAGLLATSVAAPATAAGEDVSDGLVARWTFDASTTTAMLDSSGNGHHGLLYGATRVPGVSGNALQFDGNDEAWVPATGTTPPAEITSLAVGSISMWLRYEDSEQEAEPLFYLGNLDARDKPAATIEVGHPNNNKLYFTFYAGGPRPTLCFDSNFNLEEGAWYHFVGVIGPDYNTGYLNGVEMTDRNYNAGGPDDAMFFADLVDINRLTLGSAYYHQDYFLYGHGAVDDVRIYDRPLTAAEAWALYSGTEPPANSPPIAIDDAVATPTDTPVTIDVLGNDSDRDGDALSITSVTEPGNGSATTDGATATYTPDPGWEGVDTFTYTVVDPAGAAATATVTVSVGDTGGVETPAAPANLTGTVAGATEIELSWTDTSSGDAQETFFELQRTNRTTRSPWTTVATVAADTESYSDTGLTAGSRYGYRIRAVNDAGESPWSNRIRVSL
ncbi:MAG TPA: Ig-like domain-containing protein [Acidimicrobiia bacterium]|jgi:hypothetical protein|nr:Ig-like domain-containing protein [Acidimicrobiia bacterium]